MGIFMQKFVVRGGRPLRGSVRVQGAKNSVLPMLAASLLSCEKTVEFQAAPQLTDVEVSIDILRLLGCSIRKSGDGLQVDASHAKDAPLDSDLCGKMRSSVLYLGPLLARFGKAQISYPGGCVLGARPIDLHIEALISMGADFEIGEEYIKAECPDGLSGCVLRLRYPSVGATENILMAASLAKGETLLYNNAVEPEIDDLIELLCAMGARIEKHHDHIAVQGVKQLHGCRKTVMPDRIAALTYGVAALLTDGEVTLLGCPVSAMSAPLEALAAAGAVVCRKGDALTLRRSGPFILPVEELVSAPYPAFPTDAGALMLALLSVAQGKSTFVETVFSHRFNVVGQLRKMGADIKIKNNRAVICGVRQLMGSELYATDLRAGAALLAAALGAEGESAVVGAQYILRGYENITENLRALGADIQNV